MESFGFWSSFIDWCSYNYLTHLMELILIKLALLACALFLSNDSSFAALRVLTESNDDYEMLTIKGVGT